MKVCQKMPPITSATDLAILHNMSYTRQHDFVVYLMRKPCDRCQNCHFSTPHFARCTVFAQQEGGLSKKLQAFTSIIIHIKRYLDDN